VRFRINQEIKILYCKKQNLKVQLYRIHLDCVNQCKNAWQHIQNSIDDKLNHKMDTLYQKLNKKLDNLIKQLQTTHNNIKNPNTPHKLINLTNTIFTKEHTHILALGTKYALSKVPKVYINELIIDTENVIRQLDPKLQNTFRYMTSTKIKQIMTTNTHHTLHKRYQYNLNQIKSILK
jgi:hypothetical protein